MNKGKLIIPVSPVIDYSVRALCKKPYYNHSKGCPNYGRKDGCPPAAETFNHVYDLNKPIYAICNIFDIKSHIQKMRTLYPAWSEHQLKCVLYWQGGARADLKRHIITFLREHPGYSATACPEAMGVNVTKTMANVGVRLEWPPENVAYQIALAGRRRNRIET